MLAVVEHQQHLPAAQVRHNGITQGVLAGGDAQRRRHGRWQEGRLGQLRQVDKGDSVGKVEGQVPGHCERQARLAHTGGTHQGQQRRGLNRGE